MSACMSYNKDGMIAVGADFGRIEHRFGESITIDKANTSKTAIQATKTIGTGYTVYALAKTIARAFDSTDVTTTTEAATAQNANNNAAATAQNASNNATAVELAGMEEASAPAATVPVPTVPTP